MAAELSAHGHRPLPGTDDWANHVILDASAFPWQGIKRSELAFYL
jgi:hypothetical protein